MKDLSKEVKLYCNVCGNDQFSLLDDIESELCDAPDETRLKCSDCGKEFTKGELLEEVFNANFEDMKAEAMKEFEKEIAKEFK